MTRKINAISISMTARYDYRARLFWLLIGSSLLALLVYVYAINSTAHNIALRQNLERQISQSSANLDALEFAYLELKNDITIEMATNQGFKEVKNPLYVSRAPRASLSFNTIDQ